MKNEDTIRMIIHHTEEQRVVDLDMTIENAGRIVADENILYAFNALLKELHIRGYGFELIGGEGDE